MGGWSLRGKPLWLQVTAAAASASTFSSGVSRLELLVLTARVLEGLAVSKHAGGAPQDALALRLVTIQVCFVHLWACSSPSPLRQSCQNLRSGA